MSKINILQVFIYLVVLVLVVNFSYLLTDNIADTATILYSDEYSECLIKAYTYNCEKDGLDYGAGMCTLNGTTVRGVKYSFWESKPSDFCIDIVREEKEK